VPGRGVLILLFLTCLLGCGVSEEQDMNVRAAGHIWLCQFPLSGTGAGVFYLSGWSDDGSAAVQPASCQAVLVWP
jgi:hypothetical protein